MGGRYLHLDRDRLYWGLWGCARSVRSTLLENGLYDGEMEKTQELDLTWRRVCLLSWRGGAVSNDDSGLFTDVLLCMPTIYNAMLLALGAFDIYNEDSRLSTLLLPDSGITTTSSNTHLHLITLVPLHELPCSLSVHVSHTR
jgi:hypothetical protein